MSVALLDADVLIAASVAEHEHHTRAQDWLAGVDSFALCPITEGALARFLLRVGETSATTRTVLKAWREHPACEFWSADLSYSDIDLAPVLGHRQLTDAYLVALARARGSRLATLDNGLAAVHPEGVVLLP